MAEIEKGKVYNHDVASLVARLVRFDIELYKSISSGVHMINEFDMARIRSYLDELVAKRQWISARPLLDLVEWHPTAIPIPELPPLEMVENESINDLRTMIRIHYTELVNSQSARTASQMLPFDEARFDSLIEKMYLFLSDFVEQAATLDLPESSPSRVMSGQGRQGV
jgi:hypothetical protein